MDDWQNAQREHTPPAHEWSTTTVVCTILVVLFVGYVFYTAGHTPSAPSGGCPTGYDCTGGQANYP